MPGMTDKERVEGFVNDLTALVAKWEVAIDGCGCCESPWIVRVKGPGAYSYRYATGTGDHHPGEMLRWDSAQPDGNA